MTSIDLEYVASYVVSSGDGDRCGLSELLAAIGTRRSEASSDEVFEACLAACVDLSNAGHVCLEMTPALASRPGRDGYTLIASDEAEATLNDRKVWQSPQETKPSYWLVATDSGKAKYISEEVVSL